MAQPFVPHTDRYNRLVEVDESKLEPKWLRSACATQCIAKTASRVVGSVSRVACLKSYKQIIEIYKKMKAVKTIKTQ